MEAQQHIKSLTSQLKEETLKREEQSITFHKASEEMQRFKNTLNFKYQLAQSREQKLLDEHFRLIKPNMDEEAKHMKDLVANYKKEIDTLK